MADVIPFKAWHYNPKQVAMDRVVAPPYDVISPAEREGLYERDPFNIIRVELGKELPGDDAVSNQYQRAAHYWNEWTSRGILQQDDAEGFYLYEHGFAEPGTGKKRVRLVVFGLIKLESFKAKVVLPHEKTHSGPKEDRLKLLSATRTNFSPVFGLYDDSKQTAQSIFADYRKSKVPLFSFHLHNKETHRLWHAKGAEDITQLARMFQSKTILIADGHHRYETALHYRDLQRSLRGARTKSHALASDYALMGLVELEDNGLLIFPIHRMIGNLPHLDSAQFLRKLSPVFHCEKTSGEKLKAIADGQTTGEFGMQFQDAVYRVRVKDKMRAKREMPKGKPAAWYRLEVAQIACLVLKHLGIHENKLEHHLAYTHSYEEAVRRTQNGEACLSFIVPPISASVMQEICAAGELMPQKSTYFFPKLGSGILMYHHE